MAHLDDRTMQKIVRNLGVLLAIAILPLLAAAQVAREVRQLEGVTEYVLPNGFGFLLMPDGSKPTTTVNRTYRVGSSQEGYGETGAAHLLEHMLFKGSATVADPKLAMSRRGARWNGTTGMDRTNYFASFQADPETFGWMIGWLAESMTRGILQGRDFDSGTTVVREELERRAASGFSEVEVGFARRAILSARAQALAQSASLAAVLANDLRHGHGMERYAKLDAAFQGLDAEAVNAALRRYLRTERMVEVTAGSFATRD
ncbi:MAG: insulinase family protein [Xylophilus ampelinus]